MAKPKMLPPQKLGVFLDPEKLKVSDSTEIKYSDAATFFQPRARQAFEMGLNISGTEYNIYVSGEPNHGRSYFVQNVLLPQVGRRPVPPDYVYLYNFEDPDRPCSMSLPGGWGREFRSAMSRMMDDIRKDIPARFEQKEHIQAVEKLLKEHNRQKDEFYKKMDKLAMKRGFSLDFEESGTLVVSPLIEGKIIPHDEYDRLEPAVRKKLKAEGDKLLTELNRILRQVGKTEKEFVKRESDQKQKTAKSVLDEHMGPVLEKFKGTGQVLADHLSAVEKDILDNLDQFLPKEQPMQPLMHPEHEEDYFFRYEVNLLVDNFDTRGAPVIFESNPTFSNLLGAIEREAELGALYTDFTLIKAGAVHKANHGFLILYVEDILANPSSWEGLLRALRSGKIIVEDPVEPDQVRTKTVTPDPIELDIKIILIGTEEAYEVLLYNDDRFAKFFKLKAHLQETVKRDSTAIRNYVKELARIIQDEGLLPFTVKAMAALVDLSGRVAEDQKKLSLEFPLIKERMIEACALARMAGKEQVDHDDVTRAAGLRDYRSNLFEHEYMNEYDREVIKVSTTGSEVGRVNGLSVTLFGDYEFGLPHQIACNVGVGHGGILDLEREAQLGGPIHTKAMMIIKSYLLGHFAQDKPLVLAGSLCFEQSYAGIEGDSASGAELAALLSALAEVPINLSYAFTGAVSQSGAIMAVGGVNRKIEGFFKVCSRRGLTGKQGVLIPHDNVVNLMLDREVIDAVSQGRFRIYPVKTIEQAMEILTGMPAGRKRADGKFPAQTLFNQVDRRLAGLAELARLSEKGPDGR